MLRALVKSNTYTVRWVLEVKAQNSYCWILCSIAIASGILMEWRGGT